MDVEGTPKAVKRVSFVLPERDSRGQDDPNTDTDSVRSRERNQVRPSTDEREHVYSPAEDDAIRLSYSLDSPILRKGPKYDEYRSTNPPSIRLTFILVTEESALPFSHDLLDGGPSIILCRTASPPVGSLFAEVRRGEIALASRAVSRESG